MASKKIIILVLATLIACSAIAQPGNTGWKDPGTSSNNLSSGVVSFLLPSNILSSDNSRSLVTASVLNQLSHFIVGSNFGFVVPGAATITGVEVMIEKSAVGIGDAITDNSVMLFNGGSSISLNRKKTGSWPLSDTYFTYGSDSDLWGAALTPAIVNSSAFGVGLSAALGGIGLPAARIDHIQMRVFYSVPLPVGFGDIKAFSTQTGVMIEWSTISEFNNSFFEIEQSINGKKWTTVGRKNGAGTSINELNYNFTDTLNQSGYYRVKQVDFDGKFSYSEPVFSIVSDIDSSSQNLIVRYFSANSTLRVQQFFDIVDVQMTNSLGEMIVFDINQVSSTIWDIKLATKKQSELVFIQVKDSAGSISTKSIYLQN
ncbi:MAG: hypothetical protein KJ941_09570 [Bacteroidetes bacterium]|nr:hypothetical protein [Bacteroidota bacterium]